MKARGKKNCEGCPFALPIPFGCKNIGNSVHDMKEVRDECGEEEKNNNWVIAIKYLIGEENSKCPHAANIYGDIVSCSYEEMSSESIDPISGSPYYPHIYPQSLPSMGIPYDGDSSTLDDNYVNIYRGLPDFA